MIATATVPTPYGTLVVHAEEDDVIGIGWVPAGERAPRAVAHTAVLQWAGAWLDDYFGGKFRAIDFPIRAEGTHFQRRVWTAIAAIPRGETATYGDIARHVRSGPRAIGGACGANPICIAIPCHRVLAGGGGLGGYSGGAGVETKRLLLRHEGFLIDARRSSAPTRGAAYAAS